jgi:LEA14-like dessication related protein
MKKIFLGILVIIVLTIGIFLIVRYVNYKKDTDPDKTFITPRLELRVAEVTNFTKEKTELKAKLLITNPMPVGITVDSIHYTVYIENNEVIKNSHTEAITMKSSDTSFIVLPITFFNEKLFSVLKKLENKNMDTVEYKINATFYADLIVKKSFDIEIKKRLPLIHRLEIKVSRVEVKSLLPADVNLLIHTNIINKNVFPIRAKDITYWIAIEKNPWIEGQRPGLFIIPPKNTKEVSFSVKTSFKNTTKAAFKLITEGKDAKYEMEVTFRLQNKNEMVNNGKVVFEGSGTLDQLKNKKK